MRIKFRTLCSGPSGSRQPGSVHEIPDKEALALIEGGYAHETGPAAATPLTAAQLQTRLEAAEEKIAEMTGQLTAARQELLLAQSHIATLEGAGDEGAAETPEDGDDGETAALTPAGTPAGKPKPAPKPPKK